MPGDSASPATSDREQGNGAGGGSGGEDEFEAALEGMDGEILAEREIVKASPGGSSSLPTPADSGTPGSGESDGDGQTEASVRNAPRPIPASSMPIPPPPRRGEEQIPDDIPDAKDDDIIARQLREAAMAEEDPVLKEKLWEEYRKYKKG